MDSNRPNKNFCSALAEAMQSYVSDLTTVSYDSAHNWSMVLDDTFKLVYNFDDFAKDYGNGINGKPLTSNDAFFIGNDGNCYFIEFKNGCIVDRVTREMLKEVRDNLTSKIANSLLMLIDKKLIPDCEYAREKLTYILVYNPKKNLPGSAAFDRFMQRYQRPTSPACSLFGLASQYKNVFFKEVLTYTPQEFSYYFVGAKTTYRFARV